MTKPTKWHVRPAKTRISLDIRPVWSGSSLCAQWISQDPSFFHADSEDSDQTGRMPGLIWVFAGRACHSVGFAMRRLNYVLALKMILDHKHSYRWHIRQWLRKHSYRWHIRQWLRKHALIRRKYPMSWVKESQRAFGPRQANLYLRAFRHDKF